MRTLRPRQNGANVPAAATSSTLRFPTWRIIRASTWKSARRKAADADVVVFSHPWVYPLVKDVLRPRAQLVVYDSHNVEGLLRLRLLGDTPFGTQIATHAAVIERELCNAADLVLACSHEDRLLFNELYDVPFGKCLVVPNGTFTEGVSPADARQRAESEDGARTSSGSGRGVRRQPVPAQRRSGALHREHDGAGAAGRHLRDLRRRGRGVRKTRASRQRADHAA